MGTLVEDTAAHALDGCWDGQEGEEVEEQREEHGE